MYSSLLLCLRRHARCFDFHVSLNVVVDNSFWHVFERDAVSDRCVLGKSSLWVFLFGSCPFVCLVSCSLTKRKSGWEFASRLAGLCGFWFVVICLHFRTFRGLCTNDVFTAHAHVRTEPQCDIGHTRGKSRQAP